MASRRTSTENIFAVSKEKNISANKREENVVVKKAEELVNVEEKSAIETKSSVITAPEPKKQTEITPKKHKTTTKVYNNPDLDDLFSSSPSESGTQKTVYFKPDVYAFVDSYCKKYNKHVSEVVNTLLRQLM